MLKVITDYRFVLVLDILSTYSKSRKAEVVLDILVTGGAGYIGSHTCKALSEAGCQPIVFDNLIYGHEWAVKWGPLEVGDILDATALDAVFEKYRPSAVMHFAAYAYVGESVSDPEKYYNNNVGGTLALLNAMRRHGVDKLIFSSSCATYGAPQRLPITEEHPQMPINPYGQSKLMVEQILQDFDRAYGMRSISLRYFNAAGADPEGLIGEDHDPETHLIPIALDVARNRRALINIFGDDYDTQDGTCIRDYVHVSDLADAHVLALQALQRGEPTGAYNLGNGSGFSVREVIGAVEKVAGKRIETRVLPRRNGDPDVLLADSSLVRRSLGWSPKIIKLEEIISTAWAWYEKQASANS